MSADLKKVRDEVAEEIIKLHRIYTSGSDEENKHAKCKAASIEMEQLFKKFSDAQEALLQTDEAISYGLHMAIGETIKQRYQASRIALQTDGNQTLVVDNNRPHPYRRTNGTSSMPSTSSAVPAQASPVTSTDDCADWTKLFTPDVRFLLVQRLVKTLAPSLEPVAVPVLIACAETIEKNIFEIANSRNDYYSLLGERITMENIEKRHQKLEEQYQVFQVGPSTSTAPPVAPAPIQVEQQRESSNTVGARANSEAIPPGTLIPPK